MYLELHALTYAWLQTQDSLHVAVRRPPTFLLILPAFDTYVDSPRILLPIRRQSDT